MTRWTTQLRVLDHRELLARQEAARRAAQAEMRREAVSQAEAAVARAEEAAAGLEEEAIAHERAAAEARRRCEELQRRAVAALQEKVRAGSLNARIPQHTFFLVACPNCPAIGI